MSYYAQIKAEFERNEDDNFHAENRFLMVQTFGTPKLISMAQRVQQAQDEAGYFVDSKESRQIEKAANEFYKLLVRLVDLESSGSYQDFRRGIFEALPKAKALSLDGQPATTDEERNTLTQAAKKHLEAGGELWITIKPIKLFREEEEPQPIVYHITQREYKKYLQKYGQFPLFAKSGLWRLADIGYKTNPPVNVIAISQTEPAEVRSRREALTAKNKEDAAYLRTKIGVSIDLSKTDLDLGGSAVKKIVKVQTDRKNSLNGRFNFVVKFDDQYMVNSAIYPEKISSILAAFKAMDAADSEPEPTVEPTIDDESSGMFSQLSDLFLALKHLEGQQFEADTFGQSFIKELATIEKITIDEENLTLSMLTNNAEQTGAGVEVRNGELTFAIGSKEVSFMEMVKYINEVRKSAEKKKKEDKDAANRIVAQREEENLEKLRKEREGKGKTGFDVGDTVYFYHEASESWKAATFRGVLDGVATVVYDMSNWTMPLSDLRKEPPVEPELSEEDEDQRGVREVVLDTLNDFLVLAISKAVAEVDEDTFLFYCPTLIKGIPLVKIEKADQGSIVRGMKIAALYRVTTGTSETLAHLSLLQEKGAKWVIQAVNPANIRDMVLDYLTSVYTFPSQQFINAVYAAERDGEIHELFRTLNLLTKVAGEEMRSMDLANMLGKRFYIRESYSHGGYDAFIGTE